MSDTAATNPTDDTTEPVLPPEVAPEATAEGQEPVVDETPELDQDPVQPDPLEASADEADQVADTVEVEVNGLKYRVPAALRDGYLMHGDYTSKTQELAGRTKALEGEREAFNQQAQNHRENVGDWGELAHTEKLLESFRQVNWQELYSEDPEQHQQLSVQFNVLRDQREVIGTRIQQREHDTRVASERNLANRRDQLQATLTREIPNYSSDLRGKMDDTAIRHGYSRSEIETVTDPRMMKMLHLAHLGEQVLQRKRAATAQPAPTPVKPVQKVGGGKPPDSGPKDKQGIEAWMRSRDQQLKRGTG